jgi:glutamine---fructose-6-phosphate transaminase (isomerizing)
MCGIFGYVGGRDVQEVLLCGLKSLEYRGYDSAGIYVAGAGVTKAVGKVAVLEAKLQAQPLVGYSGIAHTRWATHGVPSEVNSHPHTGALGKIYVVHNGIIENWRELKNDLEAKGMVFESETDTEVLAKLIGSYYEGDTESAVRKALSQVRGTYGIAVMSVDHADKVVVARMGSPIVIGVGDGECFVSSDPSALMSYTKTVVYLEDGELAIIDKDSHVVTSLGGQLQEKTLETMDWDTTTARKNGYAHFMLNLKHRMW